MDPLNTGGSFQGITEHLKIRNLFKKRQIYRQKIQISGCLELRLELELIVNGHKGSYEGHENVLKLHNGYTTGSNYQISLNFTLERGAVHDMQNVLNDFVKKV